MAAADGFVAIRDIHPQAPVHLLVLPERHIDSFREIGDVELERVPEAALGQGRHEQEEERRQQHGEGGHIVNTASMAAFVPAGLAGIYTASKFAVRGLSEALRLSLYPYNIGVSVFCPGLINSAIYESEKIRPKELASPDNTAKNQKFMDVLPGIHKFGMAPEEVGEKVLAGIRRNSLYIFSHPEFKDELQEIFNEALDSLPDEEAPPDRAAFERSRRESVKKAREEADRIG